MTHAVTRVVRPRVFVRQAHSARGPATGHKKRVASRFSRRQDGRLKVVDADLQLDGEPPAKTYVDIHGAMAFFDSRDVPGKRLPSRPVAFGKGGGSMYDGLTCFRAPYIPSTPSVPFIRRGTIDNSSSARITLEPVDVRPHRSAELDEFYLVVPPEYAGKPLLASWTATATDASGDMKGTIDIPVLEQVPETSWLLSPSRGNDDGDYDFDGE